MQKLLKSIIKKSKKTIEAVANEIGVSRGTLHTWLAGTHRPTSKAIKNKINELAVKYGTKEPK